MVENTAPAIAIPTAKANCLPAPITAAAVPILSFGTDPIITEVRTGSTDATPLLATDIAIANLNGEVLRSRKLIQIIPVPPL